ncbi:pyrroline-5-carboxylate reductase [Nesterenkonia sp.]|uniref:pyrroline-5-carboxylate reductase n=1 Tax=Nesterenkonia sp. TaxID=704201 RepID=UPI0026079FC7|nr:pyrroline-5-carboxylate reductase [Nesterenkonia sp.]
MLGLGSMNGAILSGLLTGGVEADRVVATARSSASARRSAEQYGVQVLAEEESTGANAEAAGKADVIFLGVKPPQIVDLCHQIASSLKPSAVVVSVAAAVTVEMMEEALPAGQPVIRTMPNTPLSVGAGVVGLVPGTHTSQEQVESVAELLGTSGAVHVLDEEQIDALTGVAGSGPAYAFYLAEHMAAAGVEMGLDPELAADLAAQTIYGAGKMLVENRGENDAAQLRRDVTSPRGTTSRAIETFDAAEMGRTIRQGAQASAARAAEITRQLRGDAA